MDISKYKDKVDKINTVLLDPKIIAGIIGIGVCYGGLGNSINILPVIENFLTHSGIIILGSAVAYISGDLIKSTIKSNNKEDK